MNEKGELTGIHERTRIEKREGGIAYSEDEGATWTFVPADTTVSMNMWGFTASILKEIKERFPAILRGRPEEQSDEVRIFLPTVVSDLIGEGKATAAVLNPGTMVWSDL